MGDSEKRQLGKKNTVSHVGVRYNKLVVIELAGYDQHNHALWRCACDCGGERVVTTSNLKSGNTQSCGCLLRAIRDNAVTRMGEYQIWADMRTRCSNPKYHSWHRYGGRGISVCDEWNDFNRFVADMGPCPDGMTLDRIDNDKGYSADNCRWATRKQQQRNLSSNLVITYAGRAMCAPEFAELIGVNLSLVRYRLRRGMTAEQIVADLRSCSCAPAANQI